MKIFIDTSAWDAIEDSNDRYHELALIYIDSLVDPLFELEKSCKEKFLPSPHVGIQFPFSDRDAYAGL